MVNANEWLDEKIPKIKEHKQHIFKFTDNIKVVMPHIRMAAIILIIEIQIIIQAPKLSILYTLLEGELNLNDFVNLQCLYVYGSGRGQQQKLTSLKIDKCYKLENLYFRHPSASNITIGEDKQPITDRHRFKTAKKIEEENLEQQVTVIILKEDCQLCLDILQEILQNNNAFARKQLEKVTNRLSNVLTAEEIQELLGKKVEINELEIQLNNLKIQEQAITRLKIKITKM
ncbi:12846_t:CDS:2 [Gigaspora margarita]|uniref:12846_t:CDS:1 n=1 Tax=Gigaspora margarita TaxID=4874 RepID=A0ABM8VZ63_GIGMA|nr:12846_t:CDS:2 [Gigaspora margarita]